MCETWIVLLLSELMSVCEIGCCPSQFVCACVPVAGLNILHCISSTKPEAIASDSAHVFRSQ